MGGPFDGGPPDPTYPAYFRHRRIGDAYLVTNVAGEWVFLTEDEFVTFLGGRVLRGSPLHRRLKAHNLIRGEVDEAALGRRMRRRKGFLRHGPSRHVVVVTRRCDAGCTACGDPHGAGEDMTPETADRVVDLALRSTAPRLTFELRGGEPLLRWDVVRRVVLRAEGSGRDVDFVLQSNLMGLDDERLAFLVDHDVAVRTTLFGPRALFDAEHRVEGAFDRAAAAVRRLRAAFEGAGRRPRLEAVPRLTRAVLAEPEALVDAWLELGFDALTLRPLEPFDLDADTRARLCYPPSEYLAFHRRVLDRLTAAALDGAALFDRVTAVLLTKILLGEDPEAPELRSPCGAGIGELAYDTDGAVFPCDAARRVGERGDDTFRLGDAAHAEYRACMAHPTVRTLLFASTVEGAPDCAHCAFSPYCGLCPVRSYLLQGNLHGPVKGSDRCEVLAGIQDDLFGRLRTGGPRQIGVLAEWAGRLAPRDAVA